MSLPTINAPSGEPITNKNVILGLSGGVDSAVAAALLKQSGANVQALHMTNWDDDDGYCTAADDLQDARDICEQLGIPLHHVNFSRQYRDQVFEHFLQEYRSGRTPNPDVLCNREIKFGVFRKHAKRLGGELLATGHYAQSQIVDATGALFKAADRAKDQSYFLNAVTADALAETVFPLGAVHKLEVRQVARDLGLTVHDKKDSTGICFIGERPFREFLSTYLPASPGEMRTPDGDVVGEHQGLMYYTLGQRKGLHIGGRRNAPEAAWYVVAKHLADNVLVVAQGEHEMLFSQRLLASKVHWIGQQPTSLCDGLFCAAKVRYRQEDQRCTVVSRDNGDLEVAFEDRQKAVAPGQYIVFYDGDRCLGGAVIDQIE